MGMPTKVGFGLGLPGVSLPPVVSLLPEVRYGSEGIMLGQALKVKVICRKGRRNPRCTQNGNREMVTVIECVSADGSVLPPMYIYKGSSHRMGWHAAVQAQEKATFA